jgi:hypothetical protein
LKHYIEYLVSAFSKGFTFFFRQLESMNIFWEVEYSHWPHEAMQPADTRLCFGEWKSTLAGCIKLIDGLHAARKTALNINTPL